MGIQWINNKFVFYFQNDLTMWITFVEWILDIASSSYGADVISFILTNNLKSIFFDVLSIYGYAKVSLYNEEENNIQLYFNILEKLNNFFLKIIKSDTDTQTVILENYLISIKDIDMRIEEKSEYIGILIQNYWLEDYTHIEHFLKLYSENK